MNDIVWLLIFFPTFVVTFLLLNHIERKMWKDWFDGKNSWWNVLYRKR